MKPELKQEYTRRISQASRTGIIVITYEIALGYLQDARGEAEKNDKEACRLELKHAAKCVEQLRSVLNCDYDIALNLMRLYDYVLECFRQADYSLDMSHLDEPEKILRKLQSAFAKIQEEDSSGPMMSGADEVYDGLTYNARGKTNTNTMRLR